MLETPYWEVSCINELTYQTMCLIVSIGLNSFRLNMHYLASSISWWRWGSGISGVFKATNDTASALNNFTNMILTPMKSLSAMKWWKVVGLPG
ncbi:uncharacterized protein G2W53_017646 [Senna tora]|uniref:Uncharacterized protein n=1 Tax=Senna tora TaxID=362788 RepID=A0A834TSB6_9FABA|nr:uncharacterized protein G2W53_017646 [Senna tora]